MMKPINILHLSYLSIWNLGQNKGRVSIFLPLKAFVDRGHNVKYLTHDKDQKSGNFDGIEVEIICKFIGPIKKKYLISITRFLLFPFITLCYVLKVLLSLKKFKPDVIYAHTTDVALSAFILSKLLKTKYVLRLYGVNIKKYRKFYNRILHFDFYLTFLLKADLYILTNDGTNARDIAIGLGVKKDKIHFLKNGIDKSIAFKEEDKSLKILIAPNNEKILITVSRLEKWKQVDIIIKTFSELVKVNSNIRLIVVGDGNEYNNLVLLSKSLNIESSVIFTGAIEHYQVIDYLKISNIFISMNSLSSMSNPVYEAMICGIPVIAINAGSTEDLINDKINGFLIESNKIDKLHLLINDVLTNNELVQKVSRNAQNFMLDEWPSWEERVKYEIELIESLIHEK